MLQSCTTSQELKKVLKMKGSLLIGDWLNNMVGCKYKAGEWHRA